MDSFFFLVKRTVEPKNLIIRGYAIPIPDLGDVPRSAGAWMQDLLY